MNSQIARITVRALLLALVIGWGGLGTRSYAQNQKPQDALTKRVEQLYQCFVDADWRKAEQYITEDSMDNWLAQPKGKYDAYKVADVQIAPDGKQANVTVMATYRMKQVAAPFTVPEKSTWVYEKGDWYIRLQKAESPIDMFRTSTATSQADTRPALSPVVWDQNPAQLPAGKGRSPVTVKVSFQNVVPLVLTIQDLHTTCSCLKAEVDRTEVRPTEKATLTLTYQPTAQRPSNLSVQGTLLPSNFSFDLPVVIGQ